MSGTVDPNLQYEMRDYLKVIASNLAVGGDTTHRGGHSSWNPNKYRTNLGLFDKAITQATDVVGHFHKSADHVASQMSAVARRLVGGAAIASLISGVGNLGKTFSRMSDIGQTFNVAATDLGGSMTEIAKQADNAGSSLDAATKEAGGSMFEMAKQAGHAGLSLEQYTAFLTRNSTATAAVGAKAMGDLQLSVRNALKDVGFYGMSLTQLDEMTSDYAETLRETGGLERLSDTQRSAAVKRLATDVSDFSAVTGKSREAILKDFNATMRETSSAMRMAADGLQGSQREAYQSFVTFFAALPGIAGQEMPKFFAQLYGSGGNAYFTEMGKTAISAGMPQLNAAMQKMVGVMESGADDVSGIAAETAIGMRDAILHNQRQLQNLANAGGEAGAAAQKLLALGQSMMGLNADQMKKQLAIQKQLDEQHKRMENATRNVMLFESNWHLLAGAFQEGFFTSLSKAVSSFDFTGKDQYIMDNFKTALRTVGEALGSFLGVVFSDKNLKFLGEQLSSFASILSNTINAPGFQDSFMAFEASLIRLGKGIGWFLSEVHRYLSKMLGPEFATILMGLAFLFRKKILGAVFGLATIRANVARIITGSVQGGGGPVPPTAPGSPPGTPTPPTPPVPPTPNRVTRLGQRLKAAGQARGGIVGGLMRGAGASTSGLGTLGGKIGRFTLGGAKMLGKGLIGGALTFLSSMALDALPEFTGKKQIGSVLEGAGYGAMIGSFIPGVGTLVGGIIGGIGKLAWDSVSDAVAKQTNDNQPPQPLDTNKLLQATPDTLSSLSTEELQTRLRDLQTLNTKDEAEEAGGRSVPGLLAEILTLQKQQFEVSTILNQRNNDLTEKQLGALRENNFAGGL